jgi:hypothetical protein
LQYVDHLDALAAAAHHGHKLGPWYRIGENGRQARCVRCGKEVIWTRGEDGDGLRCRLQLRCEGWPVKTYHSPGKRHIVHTHRQLDAAWSPLGEPVWSDYSE